MRLSLNVGLCCTILFMNGKKDFARKYNLRAVMLKANTPGPNKV